jgi:hypothetical protein
MMELYAFGTLPMKRKSPESHRLNFKRWTSAMRYRLSTLLILLAVLPPLLAGALWGWQEWQARRVAEAECQAVFSFYFGITK